MKGDDPLRWSSKKNDHFESDGRCFHATSPQESPILCKVCDYFEKKTEINRDFRKKRVEIFRDKMRFSDTFWRISR